jgi:hypothetical protein
MLGIIIDVHVRHKPIKEEAVKANFSPCLVRKKPSNRVNGQFMFH